MNKSENSNKVGEEKLRFSVIMCAYNLEKIVATAINSVLEQRFKNFELIIVNDGSADNTLSVLKRFEKKDERVKVINNEKNIGLSASRNKAIKEAKGEYIVHLDGDDTLYNKDTLKRIDSTIGDEDVDITYFGVQYVGGTNKAYLPNAQNSTKEARIVCDMHFAVASKVWRREFLEENDITFIEGMYYEDMVYSIKSAILAKKLKYGAFPIYIYYRNREGSIMATPNIKRCKDMYKMLYYLMELYEETPEELQPYLLSFIKNETFGVPVRLDGILKSLKDKSYTPVFPKRNYVFLGDEPTVVNGNNIPNGSPKVIPISIVAEKSPEIKINPVNESVAAENISKQNGISKMSFDDTNK